MVETYVLYGLLAGVITFIAGVVPLYVNLKGIRYIIAVSAGVVIATVFLDLLPETDLKNDAEDRLTQEGFDDFLPKPFIAGEFVNVLELLLNICIIHLFL